MDKAKVDYIMGIFRTLSTEVPDQMLYRENGDSIELRTPNSMENCLSAEMQNSGWNLINIQMAGAA